MEGDEWLSNVGACKPEKQMNKNCQGFMYPILLISVGESRTASPDHSAIVAFEGRESGWCWDEMRVRYI
jgi:hypothetical protein